MYKFKTITKIDKIEEHLSFDNLIENDIYKESKFDKDDLRNSELPSLFKTLSKQDLEILKRDGRILISEKIITTMEIKLT